MENDFIPFAKPHIGQEEIDAVTACLQSGWLASGPLVQKFEESLSQYLECPHVLALSSGTAALHLALLALRLKPGHEVITTPMTFIATVNTIVLAGAKPVFVDIDLNTRNIDVKKIEQAITPHTRAILPVHFAGLPVDCDAIYEIANQYNLEIIEDCAHAMGASYKNRRLGSFGHTQIFSFHPNKNMTSGEGGILCARNAKTARYVRLARFHGLNKDASLHNDKRLNTTVGDVLLPGFKYNMMDLQAAIGLQQLKRLEQFNDDRNEMAQLYYDVLKDIDAVFCPKPPEYEHTHAWHLFAPCLNPKVSPYTRAELIARMKEHGIGLGIHYTACHLYRYYANRYGFKNGDFPNAEFVGENIFSLPLFPDLTPLQQDKILETLIHVLRRKF